MPTTYHCLLTTLGLAKLAAAAAGSSTVNITSMRLGDGGGSPTTPSDAQTTLVNEVYAATLNSLELDPASATRLIAELVVPTTEGGWTVRECGLYDDEDDLIAVGNLPAAYKPTVGEGGARDLLVRMTIVSANASVVNLISDPSVVVATRSWVADQGSVAATAGKLALRDGGGRTQVAAPAAGPDAANKDYVDATSGRTGSVIHFAASSAPSGWLECDGSAVSRTAYAALFAVVGTTYGTGDGSTTFNIPDLRGEFIRGWDHGRGVDAGRALGGAQADDFKAHQHDFSQYQGNGISSGAANGTPPQNSDGVNPAAGIYWHTEDTGGSETRPRNVALMPCIKY